jgi:hypothetical protein
MHTVQETLREHFQLKAEDVWNTFPVHDAVARVQDAVPGAARPSDGGPVAPAAGTPQRRPRGVGERPAQSRHLDDAPLADEGAAGTPQRHPREVSEPPSQRRRLDDAQSDFEGRNSGFY